MIWRLGGVAAVPAQLPVPLSTDLIKRPQGRPGYARGLVGYRFGDPAPESAPSSPPIPAGTFMTLVPGGGANSLGS